MRWMMGVRISSIEKPILPPFTTRLVGLDMNESGIILSRKVGSMPNCSFTPRRKWMITKLSSGVGISRRMKGLEVSTVGTRWKLIWVSENWGQMWLM